MKSLKTKMIVIFSVTMSLVLAAIGTITVISVRNIMVPLNNNLTTQVVNARSDELGKYLKGIEYEMKTWSEENVVSSGDADTIWAELQKKQSMLRPDFEMLLYSDIDGNFYSSLGGKGTIADREYFMQIKNGSSYSLSNPVESRATGKTIFVAAHEVKNEQGKLVGVIAATILLDTFNDVVNNIKIGEKGFAWITDSTGLIIAHPDSDIRLKLNAIESEKNGFVGLDEVGKSMIAGQAGMKEYFKAGEKAISIFAPIPDTPNWSMAYTMYETELMAPIDSLTTTILIVIALAILVNAAITFFVASNTVRPIKATAVCAKALANGHLDAPLSVKSKDEIAELAQVLNNQVRQAFKDIESAKAIADKQAKYQAQEVEKVVVNLERLSRGELYCDITVNEPDEDTKELFRVYDAIASNLRNAIGSMSGYISEITQVLGEMADGNLDVGIRSEYKGDFVKLKESINGIVLSLNELISEINTASQQVAAGTSQVSDGSQAISQGASEQAASIEELTATITQIAAQTRQNALSAGKASKMSEQAKDSAISGNDQMKALQQAMSQINESSASISKIIKVIDDIAFQTNILALNAAVEAARAGVHGKGFAVVAEEVRNLAARSAAAAKETTELIEGSIKKADAGTKIADETAEALGRIVDVVEQTVKLVGEIAEASNHQASAVGQVNMGIEQMSQVVQTNSATSQQTAAAAEELSSQAAMLKEMVSKFTLSEESAAHLVSGRADEMSMAEHLSLADGNFGKY